MGIDEIAKIPYTERSDDEKLQSNWRKAKKQYGRKDWSACVMRVATSAEIAANIHVRRYFLGEHNLPESVVDALLFSANGLPGKFRNLVKPIAEHRGSWETIRTLQDKISALNKHRNFVAHAGVFKNKAEAKEAFILSIEIIQGLAPEEAAKIKIPF
jgi:hypothetical protein